MRRVHAQESRLAGPHWSPNEKRSDRDLGETLPLLAVDEHVQRCSD